MAPKESALISKALDDVTSHINPSQTLRAATALLQKIQSDRAIRKIANSKPDLLADADEGEAGADVPVWLILTTKKHVVDKKRLKPGKIALPHPYLDIADPNLRICIITADPQRTYKDLVADPSFPPDLAKRITRVIGLKKLKAKYSSFESRRQLYGEHDVFLADDRVITYLPGVLGKVFYKTGGKRPVPVTLEGKRHNLDESGNKRRKLSEGGSKVVKSETRPADVAREIERTLSAALVHLAPSTTTAVKVGQSGMRPEQIQGNVEAVAQGLVEKYVPQKWRNVKSVHIKGPDTAALPIWLAEKLWEDEKDVLEEPLPELMGKKSKKRKRGALDIVAGKDAGGLEVIEVPGGDGKMRRLEKPAANAEIAAGKKRKSEVQDDFEAKAAAERAEKATRKQALRRQKEAAKGRLNGSAEITEAEVEQLGTANKARKNTSTGPDLI